MSLKVRVQQILNDFEKSEPEEIVEVLNKIKFYLNNKITQDYLQGKIQAISDTEIYLEKKKLCKNLKPYLDWYLQGA